MNGELKLKTFLESLSVNRLSLRPFFFVLALCVFSSHYGANCLEAKTFHNSAVSFFVIDLKYNESQGVQICEIQPGIISKFKGYDFVTNKTGAAAENFCNILSTLHNELWFVKKWVVDSTFINTFNERDWKQAKNLKKLEKDHRFLVTMSQPVYDPSSIYDYQGILYTRADKVKHLKTFQKKFPGVLIVDSATRKYGKDKYTMNKLLTNDEHLSKLKPKWNLYPKKDSKKLAKKIQQELGSDTYVIKPRRGTLGHGVIIVSQDDLGKTLTKIIKKKETSSKSSKDPDFSYWSLDENSSFIVEEFVPSDPIFVPHLDNKIYDPTMRVGVVLIYSEEQINLYFVACYWKLPDHSLSEDGTLSELHKSSGKSPYFCEVAEGVREKVEQQLSEAMPRLFHQML